MERLKRYKKRIVSLMLAVMIGAIGIFSASFDSKAANVHYNSVYAEPELDGNSGYLLTHCSYSDGTPYLTIYYWKITPIGSSLNTAMDLIISSNNISFTTQVYGQNGAVGRAYVAIYRMDDNGSITRIHNSIFDASMNFNYSISLPHASSVYGNYGAVSNTVHGNTVPSVTVTWGGQVNNYNELMSIYNAIVTLHSVNMGINVRLDTLNNKANEIMLEVDNVEESLTSMYNLMTEYYDVLDEHLRNMYDRLGEQLEEQKKANTWLEKIWDSIQKFINPSDDDSQKTDEFNDEANAQKSEIDELNEQNQTEKVDVDAAVSDVDANINYDDMAQYGGVLATITNNEYILQLILVVVSIAIIAYVLFGKR